MVVGSFWHYCQLLKELYFEMIKSHWQHRYQHRYSC